MKFIKRIALIMLAISLFRLFQFAGYMELGCASENEVVIRIAISLCCIIFYRLTKFLPSIKKSAERQLDRSATKSATQKPY